MLSARRHGPLAFALCASVALASVASLASVACSAVPAETDTLTLTGPSLADFGGPTGVSATLERNCASLDCHGNDARPLRIYSKYGLRKPLGLNPVYTPPKDGGADAAIPDDTTDNKAGQLPPVPGGEVTTQEEVLSNYLAVVSLEPRAMQAVVKGADPYQLLLLKKPLLIESHKGGPALHKNGDAEKCVASWLGGKTNTAACTLASKLP